LNDLINLNVDFKEYSATYRQDCLEIFDSNTPPFFAESERADFDRWLAKLEHGTDRSEGAKHYYVVVIGDRSVACGGFYISPDGWKARMAWGMVRREDHRRGIGAEFIRYRVRRIRQMYPYCAIALDTTQHSFGFFEKMGFVVTKVTPDFYAAGLDRYDMELRGDRIEI
jgi:[ribosomal protein S18]-alanine N-acetyltransferase